jgi:hypothetical protein
VRRIDEFGIKFKYVFNWQTFPVQLASNNAEYSNVPSGFAKRAVKELSSTV